MCVQTGGKLFANRGQKLYDPLESDLFGSVEDLGEDNISLCCLVEGQGWQTTGSNSDSNSEGEVGLESEIVGAGGGEAYWCL